jgi:hypothetical protein
MHLFQVPYLNAKHQWGPINNLPKLEGRKIFHNSLHMEIGNSLWSGAVSNQSRGLPIHNIATVTVGNNCITERKV